MPTRFAEPILHVDMDAFFVEVERLRRPELRARPVLVGGSGPRAVVAAASYEAREFGVGSAMPMAEARRRCPAATVVPPDHRAYSKTSQRLFAVLHSFTPHVEPLSVDEAFLDISGLRLLYESPAAVAAALRRRIREDLSLPASVGGGTTKFIAKLASEDAKPDGMLIVPAGGELAYLHPLPVRRLWGVGEATLAGLEAMGVGTVGELAAIAPGALERRLGTALGRHLSDLARAIDARPVRAAGPAKSVSVEETYDTDLRRDVDLEDALMALCDRLSARLNTSGLAGRTVTLKLRFGDDFSTVTRSVTMADPIDHTPDLWDVARRLFAAVDRAGRGVRLLGVAAGGLAARSAARQLSLEHPRRDAAASAAERVRERFGSEAVLPARLVRAPRRDQGGGAGTDRP